MDKKYIDLLDSVQAPEILPIGNSTSELGARDSPKGDRRPISRGFNERDLESALSFE